jgi:hypothetical protein
MHRSIRTATDTSRTAQRKKWTARALTTVVVAAGSVAALAGPAQAYDAKACARALGGMANVYDVDTVRINTKQVDFGDLPHAGAGGGAPQGDAVVCWSTNNRTVAIVGRGFYDSAQPSQGPAHFVFWAVDDSISVVAGHEVDLAGNPATVTSTEVLHVLQAAGPFNRVSIHLQTGGADGTLVHSSHYYRGD